MRYVGNTVAGMSILLAIGTTARAETLTLAREGRATATVVLADDAIPAERTAARELATYLGRITGASFPIVTDGEAACEGRGCIFVGPTRHAAGTGVATDRLGPEEWAIETDRDALLLYGGRPRGTLYAVYHFLEDHLGVRWWNPYAETVPSEPTLEIPPMHARGRPTFEYREIHGIGGPREFCARSRLNGASSELSWDYGGTIRYGGPGQVHNIYRYVPPEPLLDTHPEFFALRGGLRTSEQAQLCLTNRSLRKFMLRKLLGYIEKDREDARPGGEPPPRLYDISLNDGGGDCQCKRCRRVAHRRGGEAGLWVEFLNPIARRVRKLYPDVLIDTLAYYQTMKPPVGVRPESNIVIRYSGLQWRDFNRSVLYPANLVYRERLEGWRAITTHLRIWDYSVTFGPVLGLPLANYVEFPVDLRYYRDLGIEGLFIQHEHPVLSDMRDLKLWLLAKLLEDPDRDPDELIREFTDGFYGPAGAPIRRYLASLEEAARRMPGAIRFDSPPEDYAYLDLDFVSKAQAIYDDAEAAVADDPVLLGRVRHARLSLDRATLCRWPALVEQYRSRYGSGVRFPLSWDEIEARCRRTWSEQIDLRIPERLREARRAEMEAELGRFRANRGSRSIGE